MIVAAVSDVVVPVNPVGTPGPTVVVVRGSIVTVPVKRLPGGCIDVAIKII